LVANDSYLPHAGVVMASILENSAVPERFVFYILCDQTSELNHHRLEELSRKYACQIHSLAVSSSGYGDLVQIGHLITTTYLKFALPQRLPPEVGKVIYIDSDIIVLGDLSELWNIDLGSSALGAVDDPYCNYKRQDLQISDGYRYFNSGLMLMNLEVFREEALGEKLREFIRENSQIIEFADQDAFNALLFDRRLSLPLKWNVLTYFYDVDELGQSVPAGELQPYIEAVQAPGAVHFCGPRKPWHYLSSHPQRELYQRYLELTPWKGTKAEGRHLGSVLARPVISNQRLKKMAQAVISEAGITSLKNWLRIP